MNILTAINATKKVLSLVPFLIASILGGLIAGSLVKCGSKPEPIHVDVNLTSYEKQLSEIRQKQDSVSAVLPDYADALRELSERYRPGKP